MYQNYIANEQFNFQINRFMEPYYDNQEIQKIIKSAVTRINDFASWYNVWINLAEKAEQKAKNSKIQADYGLAAAYYQLADFFLKEDDKRKKNTYRKFKQNFYQSIDRSKLIFTEIPYKEGALPVVQLNHPNAKRTLLFHGGFDSYLEELIRLTFSQKLFSKLPQYNFILFEGPGQGNALRSGLPLTYKWEEPVGAVLDYFALSEADIMGMSLGGHLAMRAAAKDSRLKRVIAFDAMISLKDSLILSLPQANKLLANVNNSIEETKFDQMILQSAHNNSDLTFELSKGMDITFTDTPTKLIKEILKFDLTGILDQVKQDILLLGGTQDIYAPAKIALVEAKQLTNARSLTIKLFTVLSGGAYHCQVGDKQLAFNSIITFLKN